MGIGDALDLCNSFLSICLGYLSEVLFSLKTEAMKSGLISNKGRQACLLQACIPLEIEQENGEFGLARAVSLKRKRK